MVHLKINNQDEKIKKKHKKCENIKFGFTSLLARIKRPAI